MLNTFSVSSVRLRSNQNKVSRLVQEGESRYVSAFEANYLFSILNKVDKHLVDFVLLKGMCAFSFAYKKVFPLGVVRKYLGIHQGIIQNYFCLFDGVYPF